LVTKSNSYTYYDDFKICNKGLIRFDNYPVAYGNDKFVSNGSKTLFFDNDYNVLTEYKYLSDAPYSAAIKFMGLNKFMYTVHIEDYDSGSHREVLVSQLNDKGEKQWEKRINEEDKLTYPWDLKPTLDDQIILSTGVVKYNKIGRYPQLFKLDTLGNILWKYTDPYPSFSGGVPINVAALSDSNFVQIYEIDKSGDIEYWQNQWTWSPTQIKWISKSGEYVMHDRLIVPATERLRISHAKRGKGDYFFMFGSHEVPETDQNHGILMKMSNEGDTIWMHRYQHPEYIGGDNEHIIQHISESDNGDITVLGKIRPKFGSKRPIWLFKVNSQGCFGDEECEQDVVFTPVVELNESSEIRIYPNPANDKILISTASLNPTKFEIYGVHGIKVQTYLVKDFANEHTLDVSGFDQGVYFINITTEQGKIITKKFVKE
jgi:hypothetical protein